MDYLKPITTNGKAIYLAYDHGMEHGPVDLIDKALDPSYILDIALKGKYNAVILQKGVAEKYYIGSKCSQEIPLIVKLNAKADIWKPKEPHSPQVCSVSCAKRLGALAVGYTIYLGSAEDFKMFKEFGAIAEEAHQEGMAAIAWVYPRGSSVLNEADPDITAYGARVGLELGADMVKIKYSGSKENFEKAVKAAGKTKVVLSGGAKLEESEWLDILKNVMLAGGSGAAVGRNVWQHKNPLEMTEKIRRIIFGV